MDERPIERAMSFFPVQPVVSASWKHLTMKSLHGIPLRYNVPKANRRAITGIEDNLHPHPRKEKLGVRYTRTRHDLSEVEYM